MYTGYGVYRFLDKDKNIIYIGMTNNIWRRIMNQHFKNSGHLSQECYSQTARVDIIKLKNNLECKALEEYLINKYKPKFNKRDKHKSYGYIEQYEEMEKWKPYRKLRDFNEAPITVDKDNIIFVIIFIAMFLGYFIYINFFM